MGEKPVDTPPGLPRGDPEDHARSGMEPVQKLAHAGKQRFLVSRVDPKTVVGQLVALGEFLDRPVLPDEAAERLGQGQTHHGEGDPALGRREAEFPEGRGLCGDDQMLAVDEGPVHVEDDEPHRRTRPAVRWRGPAARGVTACGPVLARGRGPDAEACGCARSRGGSGSGNGGACRPGSPADGRRGCTPRRNADAGPGR